MKDMIKQVALSVAHSMQKALPREMQYGVNAEFTVEFATAFLAALSERAEAVAYRADDDMEYDRIAHLNDIEAIENRVAEAICEMLRHKDKNCFGAHNYYLHAANCVEEGEWRKYK